MVFCPKHRNSDSCKLFMKIYLKERRFKADGNFTRRERAKIHHDLAHASKNIYQAKHN